MGWGVLKTQSSRNMRRITKDSFNKEGTWIETLVLDGNLFIAQAAGPNLIFRKQFFDLSSTLQNADVVC